MNQTQKKTEYILRKTGQMLLVLFLLSIIVFALARLCPGDPLRAYYGDGLDRMNEQQKELARDKLGLNDSFPVQYAHWAGELVHGDLGISFKYKRPVTEVIGNVWRNTLALGGLSFLLTFLLAIWLGRLCALRENTWTDRILCRLGVVSGSIPAFFLALLLILLFAVNLRIFPTGGAYSLGHAEDLADRLWHLVLPVTVMVLGHLWYYAYMIRNKLLEETRKDYVMLCKAQGIPRGQILRHYCFRNILPSLLVIMAIAVPHILGGTYVVEMVFAYPGLGTLSFESALYKDYNMLMALCMLTGAVVLVCNLLAQIIGEFIDPRMQYETIEEVSA